MSVQVRISPSERFPRPVAGLRKASPTKIRDFRLYFPAGVFYDALAESLFFGKPKFYLTKIIA
jgi:hypothetical protein